MEELSGALDEYSSARGTIPMTRTDVYECFRYPTAVSESLASVCGFLPYTLGRCFGVRKDALLHVGGFDSSYPAGYEAADSCGRRQLTGYTIDWYHTAVQVYFLRPATFGATVQGYFYAKSAILTWARFVGDQFLGAMSFKGSLRYLAFGLLLSPRLLSARTRRDQAQSLGSKLGVISDHLTYRLCGKVPPRQLMEADQ